MSDDNPLRVGGLGLYSLGSNPDELEAMTVLSGQCSDISLKTAIFTSSRSGTFSWIKSASPTASSMFAANVTRSGLAPSLRPFCTMVGQMVSMFSRNRSSAPGAGSVMLTSKPWARARMVHPVPITPPPTNPTLLMLSLPLNAMVRSPMSVVLCFRSLAHKEAQKAAHGQATDGFTESAIMEILRSHPDRDS